MHYEKYIHYDINIEDAVLGQIILERHAIGRVLSSLKAEYFYSDSNKIVYEALSEMFNKTVPIDSLTLCEYLANKKKIVDFGGINIHIFVTKLTNKVCSSAHLEYHAHILHEQWQRREILRLKYGVLEDGGLNPLSDVRNLQNQLNNIVGGEVSKEWKSMDELIFDLFNHQLKMAKGDFKYITTTFDKIDNMNGGFTPGELIIMGARPRVGKSSMLGKLAIGQARKGFKVGILSLEMPNVQITARLASLETDIPYMTIYRDLAKDENEHRRFYDIVSTSTVNLPIYISDKTKVSMPDIRAKAMNLKNDCGLDILYIDYLQLIDGKSSNKNYNREQEVSQLSRGLKTLARELEIPIVALAQLNRDIEKRTGEKRYPMLSDLRESGCLTGDTLIYCPSLKRNVPISELLEKDFSILSTSVSGNVEYQSKKCFSTGMKPVYQLELSTGHKIKATLNHKFLTENGWLALGDISINDRVAIPIGFDGDNNISDYEISVIGHFISNGCALKSHALQYTCNILDNDLVADVVENAVIASGCRIKPRVEKVIRKKSSWQNIYFTPTFKLTHGKTNPIADVLRKYNLFDVRSKNKFIPDEMMFMSYEKTNRLLRTLFSGDGTVVFYEKGNRKSLDISFSTASEALAYGIMFLLQKVGIVSIIYSVKKSESIWYNVAISGKSNIALFVKNIGFINKRKQDVLINGWSKIKDLLAGWTKNSYSNNRSISYIPVKSITYVGKETVYDIEVPVLHNFTANGMIVHNSLEQDADIVMFLHRDYVSGFEVDSDGNSTENNADLIIGKWRNGVEFRMELDFEGDKMKFREKKNNYHQPPNDQGWKRIENSSNDNPF